MILKAARPTTGILLYEVQQPADVTWRLYDWGRGRTLHLDLALQVALRAPALPLPVASVVTPGMTRLVDDRAFLLDRVDVPGATVVPGVRALTVIAGRVEIDGEGFSPGETAIGRDVRVTGAGSLLAAGVAGGEGDVAAVGCAHVRAAGDASRSARRAGLPTLTVGWLICLAGSVGTVHPLIVWIACAFPAIPPLDQAGT